MRIILLILFYTPAALGQLNDTVSLWDCIELAVVNHPLYGQKDLNDDLYQYSISNTSKSWYPDITLNGQASYQSDVIGFGNFTAPQDQYKVTLNISQQLFDGGISKYHKELETTNLDLMQQQLKLDFHNVKQQVSSVYFRISILKTNLDLNMLMINELSERLNSLLVSIENGVVLPENEYILKAEILKIEQQRDELQFKLAAAVDVLKEMTGLEMNNGSEFLIPDDLIFHDSIAERPELQLFDFQKMLIDKNTSLSQCKSKPRLFIFTQAGYGNPGLNMLIDEFDTYYIIGAGMSWNLIDWGENRNIRRMGKLQKEAIDLNRQNFSRNISIALRNELANIEYYKSSIMKYEKLIELKSKIKESAYTQLQNGTITATEYLTESNAELAARIQLESHRIFRLQSILNYQLIKGDI